MSFDKLWILKLFEGEVAKDSGVLSTWINVGDHQFDAAFDELDPTGNSVTLEHLKNHDCDKSFLFESATDAKEFYERGFSAWESLPICEGQGSSFDRITLYLDGCKIHTKETELGSQKQAHDE